MNFLNTFLFQIYPYIAIAVFAISCWARFDHDAYSWRTGSSQFLSNKWMRLGSNWFHIGIIAILGGHFVGLLTPHAVYEHFMTSGQKQLMAMVVGGIFGIICFVGLSILLLRRLFNARIRATGTDRDLFSLGITVCATHSWTKFDCSFIRPYGWRANGQNSVNGRSILLPSA